MAYFHLLVTEKQIKYIKKLLYRDKEPGMDAEKKLLLTKINGLEFSLVMKKRKDDKNYYV